MSNSYCGFVTFVGRPNVGKSTLLNSIVGQKLSITCHKPQTTRSNLYGIKTTGDKQAVFVDTPGIHLHDKNQLGKLMNKQARSALIDVDVALFVVEAGRWTEEDGLVASLLDLSKTICVINKIDKFKDKQALLPFIQTLSEKIPGVPVVPVSAYKGEQLDVLEGMLMDRLPESPFHYPQEVTCSHGETFRITEIVREKILRLVEAEVPYSATVQIESLENQEKFVKVHALIWVEREGQKKILIGAKGANLKAIGTQARKDMEKLLGRKVVLKCWVKVKKGWSDNLALMSQVGFADIIG